jgi:rare lipoprotein A (peptidoglycan hydrolase)
LSDRPDCAAFIGESANHQAEIIPIVRRSRKTPNNIPQPGLNPGTRTDEGHSPLRNHIAMFPAAASAAVILSCGSATAFQQSGMASYYGPELHGRRTASGERFNQHGMTAAHRTVAFGSRLKVTNLSNGRSVVVRVNDRGPFIRGRIVDVSAGAARQIGMHGRGVARVRVEKQ